MGIQTIGAPEAVETLHVSLPPAARASARARAVIDGLCPLGIDPEAGFVARLLVSELVANCLRHAKLGDRSSIELVVEVDEEVIRVEVHDSGRGFPPLPAKRPAASAESGRGLLLVDSLADRWGARSGATTCVWFELDLRREDRSRRTGREWVDRKPGAPSARRGRRMPGREPGRPIEYRRTPARRSP